MNEYIFYTTEGYTEGPNKDYPVENCQVVGVASGENHNEALKKLFVENPWISEAGFTEYHVLYRRLAPGNPK